MSRPPSNLARARSEVALRLAGPADRALVFSSWLRSYASSAFARAMAEPIYMAAQHRLIERLLERASVTAACPEGDTATVLGWICHEGPVLHYVYVKGPLRRAGIGSLLVEAAGPPRVYTHATVLGAYLLRQFPQAKYNPVRAYGED